MNLATRVARLEDSKDFQVGRIIPMRAIDEDDLERQLAEGRKLGTLKPADTVVVTMWGVSAM